MRIDSRCSKAILLKRITELENLESKCNELYEVGLDGISYVGAANYAERQETAENRLHEVMWGDECG